MREDDEQQDELHQEETSDTTQQDEQSDEQSEDTLRDEGDQVVADDQEHQEETAELGDGVIREPSDLIEEDAGELQELGVDQPTVGTIVGADGDADQVLAEHPSPAMEHGSYEAARHGLHTEASGEYDPTQARRNGN